MSSGDQTLAIRLGDKFLYPLNHPAHMGSSSTEVANYYLEFAPACASALHPGRNGMVGTVT